MTDDLTKLGESGSLPSKDLEAFPNHAERPYLVTLDCPEFTCMCPKTGQPDFAYITINYVPDKKVIESKSLKLYLWAYRNEGVFHEHVVNRILDDIVEAVSPHACEVVGRFNVRGGISLDVRTGYQRSGSGWSVLPAKAPK